MVDLLNFSPKFSRLLFFRLPFTMLVLQKSVQMVWSLPEVMRVAYAFMFVMLLWMGIWSFGVAGVVASSTNDGKGGLGWLLVLVKLDIYFYSFDFDSFYLTSEYFAPFIFRDFRLAYFGQARFFVIPFTSLYLERYFLFSITVVEKQKQCRLNY